MDEQNSYHWSIIQCVNCHAQYWVMYQMTLMTPDDSAEKEVIPYVVIDKWDAMLATQWGESHGPIEPVATRPCTTSELIARANYPMDDHPPGTPPS